MDKIYRKTLKGSYTIEAALIFPFILYIIFALIYLGFYLHDYGKVKTIIYESQIRGKGLVRNEANIVSGSIPYQECINRTIFYPVHNDFELKEKQISNYIDSKSRNILLISEIKDINVDVELFNIKTKVLLKMNFPIKTIERLFLGDEEITIECKEKIHNPTDFIRGYEVASNIGKKIDIVNQLVSQIKKIIGIFK